MGARARAVTSRRLGYAAVGLAALGVAIAVVVTRHESWWPLVAFAIAPDITLLLGGIGRGLQRGQLNPRAVPSYNAVHRFWAPAALTLVAALVGSGAWAAAGLAWIAHIGIDRSLGFGLRTPEGFQRKDS